jgi:hypothetical protein
LQHCSHKAFVALAPYHTTFISLFLSMYQFLFSRNIMLHVLYKNYEIPIKRNWVILSIVDWAAIIPFWDGSLSCFFVVTWFRWHAMHHSL